MTPDRHARFLQCGRFELPLARASVMGIVNVTPDSFSDGGRHSDADAAIAHARTLLAEGADLLDIGGESTRPGAARVPAGRQLQRILPVIEAVRDCGRPISVDTREPEVMRAVIDAGADMINDVAGFRSQAAVAAVADTRVGLCVMHMRGDPRTMQSEPRYQDVVTEVAQWLSGRCDELRQAGVAAQRLVIDPGIGFGKTQEDNVRLLRGLPQLAALGLPILVGVSRKSLIGQLTGRPVDERLPGSLAAMLAAVERGARIVRVHDVAATRDALAVWNSIEE
jgi:dihydropteroate synthase